MMYALEAFITDLQTTDTPVSSPSVTTMCDPLPEDPRDSISEGIGHNESSCLEENIDAHQTRGAKHDNDDTTSEQHISCSSTGIFSTTPLTPSYTVHQNGTDAVRAMIAAIPAQVVNEAVIPSPQSFPGRSPQSMVPRQIQEPHHATTLQLIDDVIQAEFSAQPCLLSFACEEQTLK